MVRTTAARALLRRIASRTGIRVELPDGEAFGAAAGPLLQVNDEAFFTRLARDGKIGFGEAYMAGDWDSPDLAGVLEPLARNVGTLIPPRLQWARRWFDARRPTSESNDRRGAKRNIEAHYDLSNELFALFLDESLTYSSAVFDGETPDEPLDVAQGRKIERLLDSAGVRAGSRVLEIGTGWGELAIRAARRGAYVTTVTLSTEQAALARKRIADAGFTDSVDVRIEDYRDVTGKYDAVVSVEMIEAVGEEYWPAYFRALDQRLTPSGRVGLQAILLPHDRLMASKSSWTWIHKYIFPGGLIPSEQAIEMTVAEHTALRIIDRLHFGLSYADTLRSWRERFTAHASEVAALGFDRTFQRMWTFYLAYCEAGFRARYLDVAQFTLARG